AIAQLAWCKFYVGSIEQVIPLLEQTIHLSSRDPGVGNWYYRIGRVHLVQSRTDEAILWLEKARTSMPDYRPFTVTSPPPMPSKARPERAASKVAEAQRLSDDRYSSLARLKAVGYFGAPKIRALCEATYFGGLRRAGMPEE